MRAPIEIFSTRMDRSSIGFTIEAAMQKPEYLCLTLSDAETTKEAERADSPRPRSTTFRARLNLLSGSLDKFVAQVGEVGQRYCIVVLKSLML